MKLRTWHLEGLFVATALVGALFTFGKAGNWREWVAALGVQLGFHHASVANRLEEAEEERERARIRAVVLSGTLTEGNIEAHLRESLARVECVGSRATGSVKRSRGLCSFSPLAR